MVVFRESHLDGYHVYRKRKTFPSNKSVLAALEFRFDDSTPPGLEIWFMGMAFGMGRIGKLEYSTEKVDR